MIVTQIKLDNQLKSSNQICTIQNDAMQWNQNQIKLSNQISLVRSSQIKSNQVTSRHTNLHSYFGEEIMLHLEHYENSLKRNDQDQIIESNQIKSKLHTAYDSLIC